MSTVPAQPARPRPVERFKPTNGMFVGWAGLLIAVFAVVYCAVVVHTVGGLRIALAAVFVGLVVWVTQLRPRATAYPHHLVLKNSLRDTSIPLAAIEEVAVRQTLRVFAGDHRYVCIGIGTPVREELKRRRSSRPETLGASRWGAFAERAERAAPDQTAMPYQTFVVTRIEELVEEEKKRPHQDPVPPVRRQWAWPEVAGLAVTGVAFLASLLL